jgi:nitrite reductase/ring-hydroxylating ferredoxin subunit
MLRCIGPEHREKGAKAMGEFVTVASSVEIAEGEMTGFEVGGERVAVAKVGGTLYAFGNTCTHLQCSLASGDLEGTTVTCPCHGSRFDVTTGALLRGPAQEPVQSYPVRVDSETLQVEL